MNNTLPCTLQLRNNAIVQYYDTSYLNFNRSGNKSSLKQNLKSKLKDKLSALSKITDVENINNFESRYKKVYKKHQQSLESKDLQIKNFGIMSNFQKKTLKKNVENLINLVQINYNKHVSVKNQKFVAFVTLTLPSSQKHTDKVLRKCLVRFIENLRKTYNVEHYVWKAEAQKNGNIHFHILIDRFIEWKTIRYLWNKQINKFGYVDRYQKKMTSFFTNGFEMLPNDKRDKDKQYKAYLDNKANNFTNPNTTDIHSLKGITNITNYITKYMTKLEEGKRSIIGAIWGADNKLKKMDYPKINDFDGTGLFNDVVELINKCKGLKMLPQTTDFVSLFIGKVYKHIRKDFKNLWNHIKTHYNKKLEKPIIPFYKIKQNLEQIVKNLVIVNEDFKQLELF